MLELLPLGSQSQMDLSKSPFSWLDGTVKAWKAVVVVFHYPVGTLPHAIICVVGVLHWLGDESTDEGLKHVINIVRNEKLKALFTTTARSTDLAA